MQIVGKYFTGLSDLQYVQFNRLSDIYALWNERINVISRKDIDQLDIHHVLHSLSIARFIQFLPGSRVLDVGTGGGFPGIPLAIFFPETSFTLVDSIGKKIKVVEEVASALKLTNVKAIHGRAEKVKGRFDFVVSRAVTSMPAFIPWVKKKINKESLHVVNNGILALKGGDLTDELDIPYKSEVIDISSWFEEPFFETKKIVHVILNS